MLNGLTNMWVRKEPACPDEIKYKNVREPLLPIGVFQTMKTQNLFFVKTYHCL